MVILIPTTILQKQKIQLRKCINRKEKGMTDYFPSMDTIKSYHLLKQDKGKMILCSWPHGDFDENDFNWPAWRPYFESHQLVWQTRLDWKCEEVINFKVNYWLKLITSSKHWQPTAYINLIGVKLALKPINSGAYDMNGLNQASTVSCGSTKVICMETPTGLAS